MLGIVLAIYPLIKLILCRPCISAAYGTGSNGRRTSATKRTQPDHTMATTLLSGQQLIGRTPDGKRTFPISRISTPDSTNTVLTAATAAIGATETNIVTKLIGPYVASGGSRFSFKFSGVCTSVTSDTITINVTLGTAGTSADNVAVTIVLTAATGTSVCFTAEGEVHIWTGGSGGTALGFIRVDNHGVTGISAATPRVVQTTTAVVVNTQVANTLRISAITSNAQTTVTVYQASISQAA